jgi:hypothetical protein
MRKRSIHVALAGALLVALALVIGNAASALTTGSSTCKVKGSCGSTAPASSSGKSTQPSTSGGGSGSSSGGGSSGGGSTVTPKPPKPPKSPRPPSPVPKPGPKPGPKPRPKPGSKPGSKPGGHRGHSHSHPRSGRHRGSSHRRSGGFRSGGGRGPTRTRGGAPTPSAPGFFDGSGGRDPLTGVPNFAIRHFKIPLFLMPIYQAAGTQYGIRWEYLAAINEIETNYGRNLNVSSAGALGWMQFMPATWKQYGVDANQDGRKDPYNPVDAIFAAARYLKAAGGDKNIKKGIFAYNHAGWYVDSVVLRARLIAGMSPDLVGSLTGLAQGRFPLRGDVKYADDVSERDLRKPVKPGQNASRTISDNPRRKSIRIFSRKGAPAIAVNDGVIRKIGQSKQLGRYVVLEDDFGNQFTYSNLGSVAAMHPVPTEDVRKQLEAAAAKLPGGLKSRDRAPTDAATAGRQSAGDGATDPGLAAAFGAGGAAAQPSGDTGGSRYQGQLVKERLFAYPNRPNSLKYGGAQQLAAYQGDPLDQPSSPTTPDSLGGYFLNTRGFNRKDFRLMPLREGSRVLGDTILGHIGDGGGNQDPNLTFAVRPAGKGAPAIDPKPILDGWKLLEATAIYRASGKNVLQGDTPVGQILMMSKPQLQKRVLADDRIEIYPCGRKDIEHGQISRQVLAAVAYLTELGFRPTISSLKCGHGFYTTSGNVSEHSSGNAVDIARFNGQPVLGHQQKGGLTYQAIKRLLMLQGPMKPHQLISLFDLGGPTLRMADHANHLHIGYRPAGGDGRGGVRSPALKRSDWYKLIDQLGKIDNPAVGKRPSKYAIPAHGRHGGD